MPRQIRHQGRRVGVLVGSDELEQLPVRALDALQDAEQQRREICRRRGRGMGEQAPATAGMADEGG